MKPSFVLAMPVGGLFSFFVYFKYKSFVHLEKMGFRGETVFKLLKNLKKNPKTGISVHIIL